MKGEREKPLGLDMPFDEALIRFINASSDETREAIERQKKGRPKPPQVVEDEEPEGSAMPLD